MAFVIPSDVTTFFTSYPDGLPVFADEDGVNVYLNHFEEKAKRDSAINVKKLYEVDKQNDVTLVYPTSFLYKGDYDLSNGDVTSVTVGSSTVAVGSSVPQAIATALDSALSDESIIATPVTYTQVGTVITFSVISSVDITTLIITEDVTDYSFEQIFN